MAGKQQRGQETSAKILEAALKLFESHELSIERLSEESSVSIGSIYHHFGNLHGVSATLYQVSMVDLLQTIIRAVRLQSTARERVFAHARTYIDWTRKNSAAARFIHASIYAPYTQTYADDIQKSRQPIFNELLALFEPHIRAGEMVSLPFPLYEALLIGPLAELARRWLSGGSGLDMEVAWELLPQRIWQSVQPYPQE